MDYEAPVTREGQLIFFAQFLHTGGRWERFLSNCPLRYEGNRGSRVVDVLGTAALSILCGHWRYAHINAVRGDTLNPGLLGMTGTVSEDVVRRAMKRIEEISGLAWLGAELRACVEPVLSQSWILDVDVTIKSIYGQQQGAELGHNPHKPGRPSHCYHSYFMANTRLCLGVDVLGGKKHAGQHSLPGLWSLLDALPRTHWPAMVRGDCNYGNERLMAQAEARGLPYLFKLRHTPKVKALVVQMQHAGAVWQDAGSGWEVLEATLQLSGWSRARRVVLVREAPAIAPIGEHARRRRDYQQAALPGAHQWEGSSAPWSGRIAVLVTSLHPEAYPAVVTARLYRERADAENIYDELKNQWGWNGFTTQKLAPCRLMANLVALVYNWWHLYVRLFDGTHHREAITSRPALLGGVARLVRHSGQNTIKVSLQHEKSELLTQAISLVSNTLRRFSSIAERWTCEQRWLLLLTHIFRHWLGGKWLGSLPPEAGPLLSG
ncbi:MAG TPA: transposase [Terriglobales bacterium]|nr:transposase [Terriglobales bacterium]